MIERRKHHEPTKLIGFHCPLTILNRIDDARVKNYTTRTDILLNAVILGLQELEKNPSPFVSAMRRPTEREQRQ